MDLTTEERIALGGLLIRANAAIVTAGIVTDKRKAEIDLRVLEMLAEYAELSVEGLQNMYIKDNV